MREPRRGIRRRYINQTRSEGGDDSEEDGWCISRDRLVTLGGRLQPEENSRMLYPGISRIQTTGKPFVL